MINNIIDIKFGISCFFTHPDQMEIIPEISSQFPFVSYVEFRGEYPFLFPGNTSLDTLKYYKKIIKKAGLKSTIHSTFYDINLSTLNPILQEANLACIKTFIDYAEVLESEVVVVHSGTVSEDILFADELDIMKKAEDHLCGALRKIGDYAEKKGVMIGLENLPPGKDTPIIVDQKDHIRVIKKINHPNVGALFDFAHAFLNNGDLIAYLEEIKPFLVGIHAHNNHGRKDDHLRLPTGKIDYTHILNHENILGVPFIMELKSYSEVISTLEWLKALLKM